MASLIVPHLVPSPADDCEQLRAAFQGWGTNEKLIISILGHRNAAQRSAIRVAYKDLYGQDLLKNLEAETTRDFERVLLLWTLEPAERDAVLANEALLKWRLGTSDKVLVEISCSRTPHDLLAVRRAYHARFKRSLEEDVAAHTSGDFRKLLFALVSSFRYEGDEVNMHLASSEAKMLHNAVADKAYNHDDLIRILATRSKAQLSATLNHYKDDVGNPFNKDLKTDPKDEFLSTLRAVTRCISCPAKYYEKIIRVAVNRHGTDEDALTRAIVTRAEVDLKTISQMYYERNSVPLDRAVAKDTTRDYETMLLTLLGHEDA